MCARNRGGLHEAIVRIEDVLDEYPRDEALIALVMVMMECISGDNETRRKMIRAVYSFPCPGEMGDSQKELFDAYEYSMFTHH